MRKAFCYFLKLFVVASSLTCLFNSANASVSGVVTFGDSLTDNGRASALISRYLIPASILVIPTPEAYYNGRFSNGPVWAEDLASDLGLPLDDQAVGDAQSYEGSLKIPLIYPNGIFPPLTQQVSSYVSTNGGYVNASNLYILWIGGNDYMHSKESARPNPSNVVNGILESVNQLYQAGAKNILVLNLPDLSTSPLVNENGSNWNPQDLQNTILTHNSLLAQGIANFQASTHAPVFLYDMFSTFSAITANPSSYGFTNVSERCYFGGFMSKKGDFDDKIQAMLLVIEKGLSLSDRISYSDYTCPTPNTYLFWDTVHPTAYAHSVLGNLLAQFVNEHY